MPLPMSAPKHMLMSMPELATQVQTGNPVTLCCLQEIQHPPVQSSWAIQVRFAKLAPADEGSGTAGGRVPRPEVLSGTALSANCIVTGRNPARAGELQKLCFPGCQPADGQKYKVCRWRLSGPALLAWVCAPWVPVSRMRPWAKS